MTKITFIANGQEFSTLAEAKAISKYVNMKYYENWKDPEEIQKEAEAAAARREKIRNKS